MSEVEPKLYFSQRHGLKLHVRAERKEWDNQRRIDIVIPGVYAKFVNGRFTATTQEEIDYLDEFSSKHPNEVWSISKQTEKYAKAIKKVQEEEEAEKKKAKKKGQGAIGTKVTADPIEKKGSGSQGVFG